MKLYVALIVHILMLVTLGFYAKNVRADMYNMFYEEKVEYIIVYGKPLPERNSFTCINGNLKKGYHPVRNFKGINVGCKLKKLTRGEYEDLSSISRTF